MLIWLVVWNICMFPFFGNNDPKWLIFFQKVETTNHQCLIMSVSCLHHLNLNGRSSSWARHSSMVSDTARGRKFDERMEVSGLVEVPLNHPFYWGYVIYGKPQIYKRFFRRRLSLKLWESLGEGKSSNFRGTVVTSSTLGQEFAGSNQNSMQIGWW